MYEVVTIGSATRDTFIKSKDFHIDKQGHSRTGQEGCFILGTKLEVPDVAFSPGGGGVNTAFGFARQGLETACITRVGDDLIGKELAKELEKGGVDPLFQIDKEHKTALSFILVLPDGERTILEYRGANDYLDDKEIEWQDLKGKWLFIDSLAGSEGLLQRALDWAEENNAKVAMNPGKRIIKLGKKFHKYLPRLSILISNQDETGFITDLPNKEEKAIFERLNAMVDGIVVMTKGPDGVTVSDGKKFYRAGIPKSGIVDRTGAGDAFSSGFVSAFIQSDGDISFAIQRATANSTSVVQYFGAVEGLLKQYEEGKWEKVEVDVTNLK